MLIKKELLTVPLLPINKVPKTEKRNYYYTDSAAIVDLPRSGRILLVDIYRIRDEALICRFCSDGKNYLCAEEWPAETWGKFNPRNKAGYLPEHYSGTEVDDLVAQILGNRHKWRTAAISFIDDFISGLNYEEREKRRHNAAELMKQHFAMYPKRPEDLPEYCDDNVFPSGYLFFSKKDKDGSRTARCGVCGHEFVPEPHIHHNLRSHCPACGRLSIYKADWTRKSCQQEATVCIAERVNGQLLIRWTRVARMYHWPKFEKQYLFTDTGYNLYLPGKTKTILYSYGHGNWGWSRNRNGSICRDRSFVYTNNLKAVFRDCFHGVNIPNAVHPKEEMRFGVLLGNLEKYPATEYLLKLGMTALAEYAEYLNYPEDVMRPTFTSVLGVSKQLLPMYQSMNVTWFEHQIIRDYGKWVSEEDLEEFRMLHPAGCSVDDISNLLKTMSIQRFNHYFLKQKHESPDRHMHDLVIKYRDYIDMAVGLDIDLGHKSVRFPKDVVMAHDRLVKAFEPVKDEATDRLFAMKVKPLYEEMPMPDREWKKYCIVLPQVRSDLIREGSSLNHCVGRQEQYYKNHMAGTKMIFFVRQMEKPEKPFVTMEVDMRTMHILQIYGFGDKAPAPEVRKFAESFVRELGKSMQKGKKKTA